MWDDPRLVNATASAMFGLALLLVLYAAATTLVNSPAFSLRAIRIHGDLDHVVRGQIVDALQGRVRGTFFTVDLEAIRAMFETVPWVRRAQVRRSWPDRLEVRLEEHLALARWGDPQERRLVNVQGELFTAYSDAALPLFSGPAGTQSEMARRYQEFRDALAPLGLEPHAISVSQRFSWQLRLSNGLTVQLGRDNEKDPWRGRFARFVDTFAQTLGRLARRHEYVDLRYPNGYALRVPEILRNEPRKPIRPKV